MVCCEGSVGEIGSNFGYEMEGEGESVEDCGDEGSGAAESLGDDEVVVEEDVVAVIADYEPSLGNGFGV